MRKIAQPKVTVQNAEQVYAYYKQRPINKRVQQTATNILKLLHRPQVTYDEGVKEQIQELRNQDTRFIITSNHVSGYDQNVLAAALGKGSDLHFAAGNVFTLAKAPLFRNSKLRRIIEPLGGVPVLRPKDREGKNLDSDTSKWLGGLLVDTCVSRINSGQNMAVFPEGTINKDDKSKLLPIRSLLVGRVACGVDEGVNVAILPVVMHLGDDPLPSFKDSMSARVHVGEPLTQDMYSNEIDAVELMRGSMQQCIDRLVH